MNHHSGGVPPGLNSSKMMTTIQFDKKISPHVAALREFALRFTQDIDSADDLLQDTLLKAVNYYHRFEEGTNLRGWLYTIMRNTFINGFRLNTSRNEMVSQVEEISFSQLMISASVNAADGSFIMRDIKAALLMLPQMHCIPFLRYVEGYRYEEIAKELKCPIGTVKTRIHEARKSLRGLLAEYRYVL
jgi:RNA polymerase sigma factor (sigma-70 family)